MSSMNGHFLLAKTDYLTLGKPDADSDSTEVTDTSGTDDEGRRRKGSFKPKKCKVNMFSYPVNCRLILNTFAKAV